MGRLSRKEEQSVREKIGEGLKKYSHCKKEKEKKEFVISKGKVFSYCKECSREKSKKWRENNFIKSMLNITKSSAKKRGLEFEIDIEDIYIPEFCPYLNIKLTRNVGKGKTGTNPSIDRIDNKKGYVKGNVQIISDLANSMKREASIEDLLTFAKSVIKMHNKEKET